MSQDGEVTGQRGFFVPRKGRNYDDGLDGLRTLIVGAHHVCTINCEHSHLCCSRDALPSMDLLCPEYRDRDDQQYYRLANSNTIEIDSFIDKDHSYAAYKAFTCYMLGLQDTCPTEKREQLWESVAFMNLLQHYVSDSDEPVPDEDYDADYGALLAAVADLKPEVIFAWSPAVKKVLLQHPSDFTCLGRANMPFFLTVSVFIPTNVKLNKAVQKRLIATRGITSNKWNKNTFKQAIIKYLDKEFNNSKAQKIKIDQLSENLRDLTDEGYFIPTDTMQLLFNMERWNKELICHLKNKINNFMGKSLSLNFYRNLFGDQNLGSYSITDKKNLKTTGSSAKTRTKNKINIIFGN